VRISHRRFEFSFRAGAYLRRRERAFRCALSCSSNGFAGQVLRVLELSADREEKGSEDELRKRETYRVIDAPCESVFTKIASGLSSMQVDNHGER
jgi:hypothetical protein